MLLMIIPTDAGEADVRRVRTEWHAAARRLEQAFARVQVKARVWDENPRRKSTKPTETEASFAVDHGMQKVELAVFTRDSRRVKLADAVYCVGEGTAFELRRPASVQSYRVKGIGTTSNELDRYMDIFGRFLIAHNAVGGLPISQFLDQPGFRITAADTFKQDGKSLMKVDCGVRGRVWFILDPDEGWVVQSCKFHPKDAPNELTTFSIEYGPSRDGIPLPRLVKRQDPDGVVTYCEFTDWTFAPSPRSEFTMAHYGLPDLVHAVHPRGYGVYWIISSACLLGGIAIIILRRHVSRSSSPAQT
jgi:hypothetical protein